MKWMIRTGSTPAERARLRVVYALAGTVFFMPLNLFVMEGFFVVALLLGLYYMMRYPRLPLRRAPLSLPAVGFAVAAFLSLIARHTSSWERPSTSLRSCSTSCFITAS